MSLNTVNITINKSIETNNHLQVYENEISIHFPVGAQPLDGVVEPMQQICNALVALELELVPRPATCKAGCAVCCHQLIPLSGVEVLYLQKLVAGMPRRTRRRVYAALEARRKKAGRVIGSAPDLPVRFDQRYFELGMACPFLEKCECGIYPQRPTVCREYNVDSAPHLCKSPYTSPGPHRIAKGVNLGAMLSAFSARMLGIDKWPVPMFLLERWGEENPLTRLTYDSRVLMESLLNAIHSAVNNDGAFSLFSWQYEDAVVAESVAVSPKKRAGRGTKLLRPKKLPKLLVRQAGAENVRKIIQTIGAASGSSGSLDPVIEIGAGRGYFRYLAGVAGGDMQGFSDRIIETESDERIIADNLSKGKKTLRVNATGLVEAFGKDSASVVLSMNVLDVFSWNSLSTVLDNIRGVLQRGGLAVHVMSSAIHESIFMEIAADNEGQVLLPYVNGSRLGVILTERSEFLDKAFPRFSRGKMPLGKLCASSMEEYVREAHAATTMLGQGDQAYTRVLLHEYSMEKIAACMHRKGFDVLHREWVSSTVNVPRDSFHEKVGSVNVIVNDLGTLTLDQVDGIPAGIVKETSTFGLVIGSKPRVPWNGNADR